MASYVKFETPKEVVPQVLKWFLLQKDSGKVKKE